MLRLPTPKNHAVVVVVVVVGRRVVLSEVEQRLVVQLLPGASLTGTLSLSKCRTAKEKKMCDVEFVA
jgi:hypothetical protein